MKFIICAIFLLGSFATFAQQEASQPGPAETILFEKGPYQVKVERSHFVPMRDGVRLSTDLYFPLGYEGKLPVIMERTPYNKANRRNADPDAPITPDNQAYYFASHGYVVAVQDRRGKFESEGKYTIGHNDVNDANDTLDWFGQQAWFNGRVGMMGCSIPGGNVIKAAQTQHPFLKGLIPQSAAFGHGSAGGTMSKTFLRGGVQNMTMPVWTHFFGSKLFFRPPEAMSREDYLKIRDFFEIAPNVGSSMEIFDPNTGTLIQKWQDALMHLPLVDIDNVLNSPPSDWDDIVSRAPTDPWWDAGDYLEDDTAVDGAALHINSWHDYGVNETFLQFEHFQKNATSSWAKNNQYIIISPLSHCNAETVSSATYNAERFIGDARFDFWGTYLKWYDYTLKQATNHFEKTPKLQYYLPGANKWQSSDVWPLKGTEPTKIYLASDGMANSRLGDGKLLWRPSEQQQVDNYTYDPANPVNTGFMRTTNNGAFDMAELQLRKDILVYTSETLPKPIEMTGKMRAKIWLSADVPDTDLAIKLLDVQPDGRAFPIIQSLLRLRYREGFEREVMMKTGEIYPVELDMLVGANYFKPGHKIRIEISSSNFPTYSRNLNMGKDNARDTEYQPANVSIYHGEQTPSYIELPFISQ